MRLNAVAKLDALNDYQLGVFSEVKTAIDAMSRDTPFEMYSKLGRPCVSVPDPESNKYTVQDDAWDKLCCAGCTSSYYGPPLDKIMRFMSE
jgi:hypothetical protein